VRRYYLYVCIQWVYKHNDTGVGVAVP